MVWLRRKQSARVHSQFRQRVERIEYPGRQRLQVVILKTAGSCRSVQGTSRARARRTHVCTRPGFAGGDRVIKLGHRLEYSVVSLTAAHDMVCKTVRQLSAPNRSRSCGLASFTRATSEQIPAPRRLERLTAFSARSADRRYLKSAPLCWREDRCGGAGGTKDTHPSKEGDKGEDKLDGLSKGMLARPGGVYVQVGKAQHLEALTSLRCCLSTFHGAP